MRPIEITPEQCDDWVDITNSFTITIQSTSPYRTVTLTPSGGSTTYNYHEYRIRPVSTRLVCKDVAGSPTADYKEPGGAQTCGGDPEAQGYRFGILVEEEEEGFTYPSSGWIAGLAWVASPYDYNEDGEANLRDLKAVIAAGNEM